MISIQFKHLLIFSFYRNHVIGESDYMCMICLKSFSPDTITNHQCLRSEQNREGYVAEKIVMKNRKSVFENTNGKKHVYFTY